MLRYSSTSYKRLTMALLMSSHNVYFHGKIRKKSFLWIHCLSRGTLSFQLSTLEEDFIYAAEFGDIPTVQRILDENPHLNVDFSDILGRTPLRLAVGNEHLEVSKAIKIISLFTLMHCIHTEYMVRQACANSVDPDQTRRTRGLIRVYAICFLFSRWQSKLTQL